MNPWEVQNASWNRTVLGCTVDARVAPYSIIPFMGFPLTQCLMFSFHKCGMSVGLTEGVNTDLRTNALGGRSDFLMGRVKTRYDAFLSNCS